MTFLVFFGMEDIKIILREDKVLDEQQVLELYKANQWSSAKKPDQLMAALGNSDTLIQAFVKNKLVGLGNAISDGHLVVYFSHLLIDPDFQGMGIGQLIMNHMKQKYRHFHQQILVADQAAAPFYSKCGFDRAGNTIPMWIYQGNEH
jgi:GNAT superfamily N-acetyltransferase